jgi:hypothetical protein
MAEPFLATASTTGIAAVASGGIPAYADISRKASKLAILFKRCLAAQRADIVK